MGKYIVIIQGHPDVRANRFGHALADAYADGAREAGHDVATIGVTALEFPLLRTKEDWEAGEMPPGLTAAREHIRRADHLAVFFPLWMGTMPALLKAFLEQVLRPGFAVPGGTGDNVSGGALRGKSARLVVTMGMPALLYRWYFCAHGVRNLERNILGFCGVRPIRRTLIGAVESVDDAVRQRWLRRMRDLGRRGR